jgi:hypothetical protein
LMADIPAGRSSRNGLVVAHVPDRRWRPRRTLICRIRRSPIPGIAVAPRQRPRFLAWCFSVRIVSIRIRRSPVSDAAVAPWERPRFRVDDSGVRVVSIRIRRSPVPHSAIAPLVRPRPGSIVRAVVSGPTVAPFDIFAFDETTLINNARAAAPGASIVVRVGRTVGRTIDRTVDRVGIVIVTGLCGHHE